MIKRTSKLRFWLLIGLVFILLLASTLIVLKRASIQFDKWLRQTRDQSVEYLNHYRISNLPPEFNQLWLESQVFTNNIPFDGNVHLVANDGEGFLLARNGRGVSLLKMDLLTGKSSSFQTFPQIPTPSTIALNSKYIFVGFDGTQKISGDTLEGASRISAYNLTTENLAWSKQIGGARSIISLIVDESMLNVRGDFSSHYYYLDASTGNTISTRPAGENFIWFLANGVSYQTSKTTSLEMIDQHTGLVIWQSGVDEPIFYPPILTNKLIVARTQDMQVVGEVFAVDRVTGNVIWKYNGVVSNVAVDNDVVYFLTESVNLVARDIKTGQVLNQIDFSPNIEPNFTGGFFQVAVDSNILLVYLGDGGQLFAFRSFINE